MLCCSHCSQLSTILFSIVTPGCVGGGGGGGVYSYIRVLPDGFILKLSSFQKKSVGQNTNI